MRFGKSLGYGLLVFAVLLVLLVLFVNNKSFKPNLFESKHNFGIVYPGTVLSHSFEVANPYKDKLQLTEIKSSCSCTSTIVGERIVLPGKSTRVTMKLYIKDYDGHMQENTIIKGMVGNETAFFKFVLEATAASVVKFSEKSRGLNLGEFKLEDDPKSKTFFIMKGSNPLVWNSVKCKSFDSNLKASLSQMQADKWKLNLQLDNENCLGTILNNIEISFWKNGEKCKYTLVKSVLARIVGPIVTSPSSILVGVMSPNESITRIIEFRSKAPNSDYPIEILSVECVDSDWIQTDIIVKSSKPAIKVIFSPKNEYGPKSGEIVVTAKFGKVYKIRIGYLARIVSTTEI